MRRKTRGATASYDPGAMHYESAVSNYAHKPEELDIQSSADVIEMKQELARLVQEWAASMALTIVAMELFYSRSGPAYLANRPWLCHALFRAVDRDLDEVFSALLYTADAVPLWVNLYGFEHRISDEADLGAALEAREISPDYGRMLQGD